MPDKFIRHGATFNGNGTSSAEATVDGGVGAWNSLNILDSIGTPNYGGGSLAAGDTVYIRSKDAAGADLVRTLAAATTLGSAAATAVSQITWIVDNAGIVWPGITGTLQYLYSTNSIHYSLTVRAHNRVVATTQDGIVALSTREDGTDSDGVVNNGYIENWLIDLSLQTGALNYSSPFLSSGGSATRNLHYKRFRPSGSDIYSSMLDVKISQGPILHINPQIELLNSTVNGQVVFRYLNNYRQPTTVLGGRIYGAGASTNQALVYFQGFNSESDPGYFTARGLQYPNTMNVFHPSRLPIGSSHVVDITGADRGAGAHYETGWGFITSRSDNFPPVLSTTLPDGLLSKWAWRLYPRNTSYQKPAQIDLSTYSQGATGVKTVSLEFLVETNLPAPTRFNTWIDVAYIDENNIPRVDTTQIQGSAALCDTSTADWSTTTWGMSSFNKYRLSAQTAHPVKQGTALSVSFFTVLKASSTLQVLFVNPEAAVV